MTSSLHGTDSSPHPARAGDCRGVVRLKCCSGLKTGELTHKIDGNPTCDFSKARFAAIHFQTSCCGRPGRLLSLHLPARTKKGKARDRARVKQETQRQRSSNPGLIPSCCSSPMSEGLGDFHPP